MRHLTIILLSFTCTLHGQGINDSDDSYHIKLWQSKGETSYSFCSGANCGGGYGIVNYKGQTLISTTGDPTSRLTWQQLKTTSLEITQTSRLGTSGWYWYTAAGLGNGHRGHIIDEDWIYIPSLEKTLKFSDTKSDVDPINVGYYLFDVGKRLPYNNILVTPFAGLARYMENMTANGMSCRPIDDVQVGGTCASISDSVRVLGWKTSWTALRLGTSVAWQINPQVNINMTAAYLPIVSGKGTDTHYLRPDLQKPSTISTGHGDGFMLDIETDYSVNASTKIQLGYRYWSFKTRTSDTTFHFTSGSNSTYPGRSLLSKRDGFYLSASHIF